MNKRAPSFGLWYDFRQILPHPAPYARFYAECLEEIVAGEALGYRDVWLSEHHLVDDGYLPGPLALAALIAGRTKTMGVGTNVLLLPLYHPMRVAEDAAVIDLASGGRLTLGVGLGYVQHEFEAFGVERRFRPSLLEEGIAVMRQAWETGRTGFQGKRWQLPDLPFAPQPARRIPIYLGGYADAALERAARLGDGFLASGTRGVETFQRSYTALAAALPAHGRAIDAFPYLASAILYVHEDPEQAWRDVAAGIAYQANRYAEWRTDREQPKPPTLGPGDLDRRNYLIGTPEQVTQQVLALHTAAPFDQLCFWGRLPGLTHDQALASMRLFAEQVAPAVRGALGS